MGKINFHGDCLIILYLMGIGTGIEGLKIINGIYKNKLVGIDRIIAYLFLLKIQHFLEFLNISISHKKLEINSFLLSEKEYLIYVGLGIFESFINYKKEVNINWYVILGLTFAIIGQSFRTIAMRTAGDCFTHEIRTEKNNDKNLIKTGVYKIMRHPGYFGWYLSSIGHQIILNNKITLLLVILGKWYFFKNRIRYEEKMLIKQYNEKYIKYRAITKFSGIPFVY